MLNTIIGARCLYLISKLSKSNSSIDHWWLSIDDYWFKIDSILIISIVNPQSAIINQSGGGERIRTDGLLSARQALSQLGYSPDTTLWAWVDLNHWPHAYQACALTTWATGPSKKRSLNISDQTLLLHKKEELKLKSLFVKVSPKRTP